jgi:hypothetical protein
MQCLRVTWVSVENYLRQPRGFIGLLTLDGVHHSLQRFVHAGDLAPAN